MNQGIAFARTLRALDADGFGASKLGLGLAALLFVTWIWWACVARVPQYETTTNVRIGSGHAIAYFPADAISRISVGQTAVIHFNGSAFSSRVASIASDHVDLTLPPNPQLPIPASVEIEVSQASPGSIALQSLGLRN